jgi:hypothetical protein
VVSPCFRRDHVDSVGDWRPLVVLDGNRVDYSLCFAAAAPFFLTPAVAFTLLSRQGIHFGGSICCILLNVMHRDAHVVVKELMACSGSHYGITWVMRDVSDSLHLVSASDHDAGVEAPLPDVAKLSESARCLLVSHFRFCVTSRGSWASRYRLARVVLAVHRIV